MYWRRLRNAAHSPAHEIGLVLYPGAQQAAVFGLPDLFGVANRIAATCPEQPGLALRITHWRQETPDAPPVRMFDNGVGPSSVLTALILPPALDEPSDTAPTTVLAAGYANNMRLALSSRRCAQGPSRSRKQG